jgi:hypothetical protein
MEEITITNYNRKRRWGWGYSFTPTRDGDIRPPETPNYEGTLGQISEAREADPVLRAHLSCYSSSRWFWDGRPIVATWTYGIVDMAKWDNLSDENYLECPEEHDSVYGWAWFYGFHLPLEEGPDEIKIRVE